MLVRPEVRDFLDAGPLPSENAATEEQLAAIKFRLERIPRPVTDAEAQALTAAFGSDDCYGLSWSLLHLIETAPGARHAHYPRATDSVWVQLLAARGEGAS